MKIKPIKCRNIIYRINRVICDMKISTNNALFFYVASLRRCVRLSFWPPRRAALLLQWVNGLFSHATTQR